MSKSQVRKARKHRRYKQKHTNAKLKRKLFGHLFIAPCCYCKRVFLVTELTVEHIIPLCLGGTNEPSNIALACQPCNHERGREAWFQRQQLNKSYYEQYHSQHRSQNRSSPVQESVAPLVHCQGDGIPVFQRPDQD